jgi:hypothetical protein
LFVSVRVRHRPEIFLISGRRHAVCSALAGVWLNIAQLRWQVWRARGEQDQRWVSKCPVGDKYLPSGFRGICWLSIGFIVGKVVPGS